MNDQEYSITPNSQSCFVATVVYGDINAQELDLLRHYRDNVLMNTFLGRAFVDLYYGNAGERIAEFVKTHARFTIPAIKRGLDGLIGRHAKSLVDQK
jgi:hypothetical protein